MHDDIHFTSSVSAPRKIITKTISLSSEFESHLTANISCCSFVIETWARGQAFRSLIFQLTGEASHHLTGQRFLGHLAVHPEAPQTEHPQNAYIMIIVSLLLHIGPTVEGSRSFEEPWVLSRGAANCAVQYDPSGNVLCPPLFPFLLQRTPVASFCSSKTTTRE